jgi:hypothetical protein
MRLLNKYLIALSILILPVLFSPSCQTHRGEIIPYVKVDEYFLIYSDLYDLGVLGTKFVRGGVNGIVLYRESDFVYRAYDRTCTLWPEHNAAVVDDTLALRCPECGSVYIPSLGAMPDSKSGPAVYGLIEYKTVVQNDVLHVFN